MRNNDEENIFFTVPVIKTDTGWIQFSDLYKVHSLRYFIIFATINRDGKIGKEKCELTIQN